MDKTADPNQSTAVRDTLAHGLDVGDTPWLIRRFQQTGDVYYGEKLIELNRPLAISRAKKMHRPGTELDDLIQVALMGMWKAIGRYDHERGVQFSTYAVRTMDGELKRYFRDKVWQVHVPRGLKRTSLQATKARRAYIAEKGTEPNLKQLAVYSGMSIDELKEGLQAADAYRSSSLDKPVGDGSSTRGDLIPDEISSLDRERLLDAFREMKNLPERQRKILYMRFYEDQSQREIAERIGCSQMHISRLLRRALGTLRTELAPV